jgi:hypothetical protein
VLVIIKTNTLPSSLYLSKVGTKKIIGQDTSLGKPITAPPNFKIDPAIGVTATKVVFRDEFVWDVWELDADLFGIGHGSVQIEIFDVDGAEAGTFPGENAVEEELDEFERGLVGANIVGIADSVAAIGDTGAVRIILLRTDIADDHGVADFLALVKRDVVVVDETEGVGTCYPLAIWPRAGTDALAETTEFVGIGGIPHGFVTGVTTKLAMFKEFTCSRVQEGEGRRTINFL